MVEKVDTVRGKVFWQVCLHIAVEIDSARNEQPKAIGWANNAYDADAREGEEHEYVNASRRNGQFRVRLPELETNHKQVGVG